MTRETAVAVVQKIMDAAYADDAEADRALAALDRAFGCPSGYVSDLIFWPKGHEPTAAEVVEQALAYRPFAL
ncbi:MULTISPECIES: bacteriocin immunity protein [unclassified Kitasatospora]|uniref:bacteriocin immunity protein n=1 Tax=unclassified Kitasatospora TaxID=2633591 RepID=UPI00070FC29A|nr:MULTISPECIES: bacteriocin immunity protein [unclassified Kitasatospora]KQV05806.1 e9imm peptide [Kitasatospora sp. Root107]KRB62609.1 e9imm peptide [Kitasatospora sp. Root187]